MRDVGGILILLFVVKVSGFLNIEELKTIDYGIDILDKPIAVTEVIKYISCRQQDFVCAWKYQINACI